MNSLVSWIKAFLSITWHPLNGHEDAAVVYPAFVALFFFNGQLCDSFILSLQSLRSISKRLIKRRAWRRCLSPYFSCQGIWWILIKRKKDRVVEKENKTYPLETSDRMNFHFKLLNIFPHLQLPVCLSHLMYATWDTDSEGDRRETVSVNGF